jgi:hypothetical protein
MYARIVTAACLLIGLGALPACSGAPAAQDAQSAEVRAAPQPPGEPTLDEVRAAAEQYRDVEAALSAGYVPDPSGMCVTAEMEGRRREEGAMGIHYFHPDLLGITGPPNPRVSGTGTYTDFRRPAILIYEPQANGSLELLAVENLVFIDAWERSGNRQPPSFHGVPYDRMEDDPATEADEAHGFEPHYDRHVWIFRENPNGVFSPFNPNVTCAHATENAHAAH